MVYILFTFGLHFICMKTSCMQINLRLRFGRARAPPDSESSSSLAAEALRPEDAQHTSIHKRAKHQDVVHTTHLRLCFGKARNPPDSESSSSLAAEALRPGDTRRRPSPLSSLPRERTRPQRSTRQSTSAPSHKTSCMQTTCACASGERGLPPTQSRRLLWPPRLCGREMRDDARRHSRHGPGRDEEGSSLSQTLQQLRLRRRHWVCSRR